MGLSVGTLLNDVDFFEIVPRSLQIRLKILCLGQRNTVYSDANFVRMCERDIDRLF